MGLPENFLQSLEGVKGFDRQAFETVHAAPQQVTSIRINPTKTSRTKNGVFPQNPVTGYTTATALFADAQTVPWSENGYYLNERPSFTFDPFFHAGCYYVQEASSMFLEQAVKQLMPTDQPLRVLDISAAPGGKSTHLQSILPTGSVLVSNEVIRARMNVLVDNVIKWGTNNVLVTNNDPSAFRELKSYFDLIVVDAPCSGSGLFRRDPQAIHEWSLNNVQLCSQRQQRIIADVLPALKQGGLLLYSTCSYSQEEDEAIADWLSNEWSMQSEAVAINPEWGIVTSTTPTSTSYRFFPDKVKGEGFFLSCFRKTVEEGNMKIKSGRLEKLSAAETQTIKKMVKQEDVVFTRFRNAEIAIPASMQDDFNLINSRLNLHYAGVRLGEVIRDKLVPDHALAMSNLLQEHVMATSLDYQEAIQYLQKQDLQLNITQPGWQLVQYQQINLGWINALKNRINNYYPKDLRILKQQNTSGSDNL